ncbi:MAG: outer membrane protein transport protein, partial [Acidobacteriota bacterium]
DGNPLNGFEVIGFSNLSGDGNELGFNAALSWRTDSQAFALTYRTGYEVDIDGTIEYDNFGPLAGAFIDSPGTTRLDLPAQATIAYGFTIGRSMKMEFDIAWAEWSAFEEIDVDIRDNTPFSQDFVIEENWDDTFSYRVGLTWEQSEQNEFRFGAVYDESPVPEEWLRPSIPDADRFGATVGWGYNNGGSWSLDSYYMALFFDDITAIPGNEGVVGGTYESFAHLAGVSVNFSF